MSDRYQDLALLRDAAAVQRFHTNRKLRQQNLAEHSFGVMQLIRYIWPEARREVYLAAMHHDLPEFITGDIPAPIKRRMPTLAVALEQAERGAAPLYQDFGLTPTEEAVLKWCDTMELVLWCLEEIQLGSVFGIGPCATGLTWLYNDETLVYSHPTVGPVAKALLDDTFQVFRKGPMALAGQHAQQEAS